MLVGPSAIAFVDGDVVEAAKGLRDFARANPLLVIKGGVLDGKAMTAAEITKLADLESREVLLAKLAGAMKASLANARPRRSTRCRSQMARLAEALRAKRAEAEGAAEARAAEAARLRPAPRGAGPGRGRRPRQTAPPSATATATTTSADHRDRRN